MWKSAVRAPSFRVLPWHLPYNWGKNTQKSQSGYYYYSLLLLCTVFIHKITTVSRTLSTAAVFTVHVMQVRPQCVAPWPTWRSLSVLTFSSLSPRIPRTHSSRSSVCTEVLERGTLQFGTAAIVHNGSERSDSRMYRNTRLHGVAS
jgi:hypothetical protein